MKAWLEACMDEEVRKSFEDLIIYGEVWYPHPPSVAELTAQNVSHVRSSVVPSKLILERFASTKMLQNNVLNSIFTRNEYDKRKSAHTHR